MALAKNGLKELRLLFCVESAASQGMRSFVKKHFNSIQSQNKDVKLLFRYGRGTEAKILAQYPRLNEKIISVENMSEADIETEVRKILE